MEAKRIEFTVKVNGKVVKVVSSREEAARYVESIGGVKAHATVTISHRYAK